MLQNQQPSPTPFPARHRPASGHTPPPPPPPSDDILPCPRCASTNTKFCYYNNYSLAQPRHFCKNCRRYWTKGGALRNVPVGGGCRKNKRLKQPAGPAHADSDSAPLSSCSLLQLGLDFYPAPEGGSGSYGSFSQPSLISNLPSFDTSLSAMAYYPSSHSIKQEADMLYNSCSFNSLFAEGSTAGSLNLAAMEDQISTYYNTSRESYDETLGLELAQSRVPYHKLAAMQLLNSVQNGGEIAGEHLISLLPDFVSGAASSSDQSYMEAGRPVAESPAGSAVGPIF